MNSVLNFLLPALIYTVLLPSNAFCYVGPGAGLTAIGSFIALCVALVVGVLGFLWFPIKRILRKKKTNPDEK